MSYAHEIFGVRETRHDIWMQDLLLAGTSSATFNSDRMREIAASPFVKDNGWAGYYLLLWCKYNNVSIKDIFQIGQNVAIRNIDYGTVDNYVLVSVSDTVANFVSSCFVGFMPTLPATATHYDGVDGNTIIGQWLRGETPNWCSTVAPAASGLGALTATYAYGHGIPEELKDILKQNKSWPTYFYPVMSDEPYFLYNSWYKLGVRNVFGNTAIHTAKILTNNNLDAKFKIGRAYWSVILPMNSTETNAYPLLGPSWLEKPSNIGSISEVNALSYKDLDQNIVVQLASASLPSFTANTTHLARFTVEL